MGKRVVLGQADVTEIRKTLEQRLTTTELERLHLKFEDKGLLPAAAIVSIQGVELRIEKDKFDNCWTIATNEGEPRLLDRVEEAEVGPGMMLALQHSVAQLQD